jgi:hypothetical protein
VREYQDVTGEASGRKAQMSHNVIKTISVIGSALFSVAVVGVIFMIFDTHDETLRVTLVAMVAAGTSLSIFTQLNKRFGDTTRSGQQDPNA